MRIIYLHDEACAGGQRFCRLAIKSHKKTPHGGSYEYLSSIRYTDVSEFQHSCFMQKYPGYNTDDRRYENPGNSYEGFFYAPQKSLLNNCHINSLDLKMFLTMTSQV